MLKKQSTLWVLLGLASALPGLAQAPEGDAPIPVVAPGDDGLDGSFLEAFQARYAQKMVMGEESQDAGFRTIALVDARYPAGEGVRLMTTMVGQATVSDEVQMLRAGFAPVARIVSSVQVMHQVQVYSEGKVQGYQIAKDGSEAQPIEIEIDGNRFDGASVDLVLTALPLSEGYRARLPVLSTDFGPELANLWCEVTVKGKESVEAAGRTYEAWIVEKAFLDGEQKPLEIQGQPMPTFTSWIASEPPYVVKANFGPMQVELVELQ